MRKLKFSFKFNMLSAFTGGVILFICYLFSPFYPQKETTPFFSVLIPTYNRAHLLPQAIDSILRQSYQNFELIILDDGSSDNTAELLKTYQQKHPFIYVHQHKKNQGVAHARNKLTQLARGKYIALLDSDDVAHPDWLKLMYQFIQKNPHIDLIIAHKEQLTNEDQKKDTFSPLASRIFVANSFENVGNVFSTAFVKKHHITYDTQLVCGEDYDFWAQMILKGAKIDTLDDETPLVKINRHNLSNSSYQQQCNNAQKQVQQKFQKALNLFIEDNKVGECQIFMHFNEKYPTVFSQKIKDEKRYCPYFLKLKQETQK